MEDFNLAKAREALRQYEELPGFLWDLVAGQKIGLADVPVYGFVLKSWWERHWNPHWNPLATAAQVGVEQLLIGSPLLEDYFDLKRGKVRGTLARLGTAQTPCGNPLLWTEIGAGRGCKTHFRLFSWREKGQLLAKYGEDRRRDYDKVHAGFFLPWGNIWHGKVTRYFEAAPLCLEGGGLFLWLLHRANRKALQTGQTRRGLGVLRETLVYKRREIRVPLGGAHLERSPYPEALAQLEQLGWIRAVLDPTHPTRQRQPQLSYAITEAPATIIEFLALAQAAQRDDPMQMADVWITEVIAGTRGIVWASNCARDLGWPLTSAGYDLACVEINRLRMLTDTFAAASKVPDYILDTISAFPEEADRVWLTGNVLRLIRQKGLERVWDVIYAAQQQLAQQPESIHAPVGWIKAAIKADPIAWPLPRAPQPVDYSKYTEGQFAYLFTTS